MGRNILIGILVALLISGGAVGAYFIFKSDSEELAETSETSEDTRDSNNDSATSFSPLPTTGTSFVATMNGNTSDGASYTATIRHAENGNTHYEGTFGEDTFNMYFFDNRNIICSEGTCIATPTLDAIPVSTDQYEYDEDDFDRFQDIAEHAGQESCNSGTCDVWRITDGEASGKILVASGGRVDSAEWQSPDGNFTIVYEYTDVQIELPADIIETPIS